MKPVNTHRCSALRLSNPCASRSLRNLLLAASALALFLLPRTASAQLEEFGIQDTNNSAALQQQGLEAQKQAQQQTGQCTDPDPTNCPAGGNGGGGLPGANQQTGQPNLQFQQPNQPSQSPLQGYNERYQPQYIFRPQQPSEYQRYVAEATGVFLPVYGADLFTGVPSTFAPLQNIPVPQDYVLGPGDEVLTQAVGQISFDLHLTVDRSGDIQIPRVGTVRVAGKKYSELQPFLEKQVGRLFRNFTLTANLGQLRTMQVFVTGQARRPGSYTLSSLSTLVNAIFAVGGPAANGSMRNIQVRREGSVITSFDLYDLLLRGDKSKDVPLLPGDVLYFPESGPRIAIFGSVEHPAIYEVKTEPNGEVKSELNGEITVGHLLDLAGGITTTASTQNAEIERIEDRKLRHVLELTLDATGRQARLQNGDILRVLSLVPRFDNAVVLRGNVANPGTYAFHDGMKLRDLIPDRDSLLTRDYWRQRAKLGLPVLDYAPANNDTNADSQVHYQLQVVSGNEVTNAVSQRAQQAQGFNQANSSSTSATGVNSVRVNGNQANESILGATTALTQENTIGNATSAGAAPPVAQRFPPRNNVELQTPDINWSYAVIERTNQQTLQTELLPFHLGALVLEGDQSQDLALQPGDVVTIFSQADMRIPRQQQTRLVHIEGEVVHAGVYSVQPGETLRQVVERAGGLSPNAYLYGASFTRESVRQQQQQRLDEYVNQLTKDLDHSSAQAAINGDGNDTAQNQQQTIAQLRALRASGRIVLNIHPDDHSLAAVPDIPLEDGDHLLVPPVPSSVNVVGSVYNQSSFVFEEGRREGDYLREAGGPDRLADRRHEFIVRADGAVVSRNFSSGKLLASFDSEHIHPGDTIVVPQRLISPSALKLFLEYSSVFSTLALAAATLSVIK